MEKGIWYWLKCAIGCVCGLTLGMLSVYLLTGRVWVPALLPTVAGLLVVALMYGVILRRKKTS